MFFSVSLWVFCCLVFCFCFTRTKGWVFGFFSFFLGGSPHHHAASSGMLVSSPVQWVSSLAKQLHMFCGFLLFWTGTCSCVLLRPHSFEGSAKDKIFHASLSEVYFWQSLETNSKFSLIIIGQVCVCFQSIKLCSASGILLVPDYIMEDRRSRQ